MKGQTLIEVLLALGVAVAIITAITAVVSNTLNNATFTKNQNLADQYAQQGMEVVRAIRDKSWSTFISYHGVDKCLPQDSSDLVNRIGPDCDGEGNVGIFIREIGIKKNDPDCKPSAGDKAAKATVSVKWPDSKCPTSPPQARFCHEARLVSCFSQRSNVLVP